PMTIRGPDLVIDLFKSERGAVGPGQSLADFVDVTVRNAGSADAGGFSIGIYLSSDPVITTSDTLLTGGAFNVAALPAGMSVNPPFFSLAIPSSGIVTGQQFIGVLVDGQNGVAEDDETNNTKTRPITVTNNTWTIMAFLDGDGNRELQALRNMDQMEQVQMPAGVNVVAMVDRHPAEGYGSTNIKVPSQGPNAADWTETRRGLVAYDGKWNEWATDLSPIPGRAEWNMGDGNTLETFVDWAMANYPAQHYVLTIYDHGGGLGSGISLDETSGDMISTGELRRVFDNVPFVDIFVMDACNMQQIELVTEFIGEVGYVHASESERMGHAHGSYTNYDKSLQWLADHPNASARDLAIAMFDADTENTSSPVQKTTVSVLDMSYLPELNRRLDDFTAVSLVGATADDWARLRDARYKAEFWTVDGYRDLREYLTAVIDDSGISAAIRDAAGIARIHLDRVILRQKGPGKGLVIYLPEWGNVFPQGRNGQRFLFYNDAAAGGTNFRDFFLKWPCGGPGIGCITHAVVPSDWGDLLLDALESGTSAGEAAAIDSAVDWPDDVDFFRFTAAAGQVLNADVYGQQIDGRLVPMLTLYGPDQTTVLAQMEPATGTHARLEAVPLAEDGDYYLAVTSRGNRDPKNPVAGESVGEYSLTVIFAEPDQLRPQLTIEPAELDFGAVVAGLWTTANLRLTNTGTTALQITAITTPDGSPFWGGHSGIALPLSLAPGGSIDWPVAVRPEEPGPIADTLQIASSDPDQPVQSVQLAAEGVDEWQAADVGEVQTPGSDFLYNGVWTIDGSGEDIGGSGDEFHFVYRPLTGDGAIVAHVVELADTHESAKAGVMIRQTLEPGSAHAMTLLTPDTGAAFLRRAGDGEASTLDSQPGVATPYWVALVRQADTFTSYISQDGETWDPLGSETIAMAENVYAGLAVTSHIDGVLATATLDNVSLLAETVVARHVFYNNSALDGFDSDANVDDDNARAPDKAALLPGVVPTSANVTNFAQGITGIMVDIDAVPQGYVPIADDFSVLVTDPSDSGNWIPGPAPRDVKLRRGAGDGDSDRITLVFNDGDIRNQWLQVTVYRDNFQLPGDDVFYFGNAAGDVDGDGAVGDRDLNLVLSALGSSTPSADLDQNGTIDVADVDALVFHFGAGLTPFAPPELVASITRDELFGPVENPAVAPGVSGSSLLAMPIGPMPYEAIGTLLGRRSFPSDRRTFIGPTLPQLLSESRPLIRPTRSAHVFGRIDETSMLAMRRAHVDATFARMAAARHTASRARYWLLDDLLWEGDLAPRSTRHRSIDVDQALEDELVWN
ncbi:MAG: clostripain-related cysteine peptidase, partial [Thermoguttaceae bacterium]